jgi:hypothetical protein
MAFSVSRAALFGIAVIALSATGADFNLAGPAGDVAFAKSPNSSQHGNNGNGNGRSGERGNSSNAHANRGQTASVETQAVAPGQTKERNIHALLGGLNSLQRNVNGLMNSSDPRMDQFRSFVEANANFELAVAALEEATQALEAAGAGYQTYVGDLLVANLLDPSAYADLSVETLQARYDEIALLEPLEGDPLYDEMLALDAVLGAVGASQQLADLQSAQSIFDAAAIEAAAAEAGTGEADLVAALLDGANPNRVYTEEEMARMVAWANEVLGVGDFNGTIDDLLALWAAPVE